VFFVACILISLEYLHKNTIIHRDVKPENLVFDKDGILLIIITFKIGYLRLTDMGIARIWKPDN
jgi:serum/glucocorticoid-regulated kinase 1/serum/glucocorticoid-regulated kinase 2